MLEIIEGQYTIKRIFQNNGNWERFREKHREKLRQNIIDEVGKMLGCRDPLRLGYHKYICKKCGLVERIVPHSCKSRFCSSCGKVMVDQWIERSLSRFVDVPYHHLVFTIPAELRHLFRWDRSCYGDLFTAVQKTLLEWCASQGFVPGIVAVLHTFGSDLKGNPHIHVLITEGGLSLNRKRWIRCEFIPWRMLKERWKYHVVDLLRPKLKRAIKELRVGWEYLVLGDGPAFRSLLGFPLPENLVRLDGDTVG